MIYLQNLQFEKNFSEKFREFSKNNFEWKNFWENFVRQILQIFGIFCNFVPFSASYFILIKRRIYSFVFFLLWNSAT